MQEKNSRIHTNYAERSAQSNTNNSQLQDNNQYDIQSSIPKIYNSQTVILAASLVNWFENSTFLFCPRFYSATLMYYLISYKLCKTDAVRIGQAIYNN